MLEFQVLALCSPFYYAIMFTPVIHLKCYICNSFIIFFLGVKYIVDPDDPFGRNINIFLMC